MENQLKLDQFTDDKISFTPEFIQMLKQIKSNNTQIIQQPKLNVSTIGYRNTTPEEFNQKYYTKHGKRKKTASEPIKTVEDYQSIINYFLNGNQRYGVRNYAIFVLGVCLGLRASDLLKLQIGDLVNEDGTFRSNTDVIEKKTGKRNLPKLTIQGLNAVAKYLNTRENLCMDDWLFVSQKKCVKYIKDRKTGEYIPNDTIGKMEVGSLNKILTNMRNDLGLPEKITSHVLRKTLAYWALELNKDDPNAIYIVQEMLNHKDIRTTMRYTTHHSDNKTKMYESVAEHFNTIGNEVI